MMINIWDRQASRQESRALNLLYTLSNDSPDMLRHISSQAQQINTTIESLKWIKTKESFPTFEKPRD